MLTTGDENVAVGGMAGDSLTTGGKNTFIGRHAGGDTVDVDNAVWSTSNWTVANQNIDR